MPMNTSPEAIARGAALANALTDESGVSADALTVGVVLGLIEGMASEGRTLSITMEEDGFHMEMQSKRGVVTWDAVDLVDAMLDVLAGPPACGFSTKA